MNLSYLIDITRTRITINHNIIRNCKESPKVMVVSCYLSFLPAIPKNKKVVLFTSLTYTDQPRESTILELIWWDSEIILNGMSRKMWLFLNTLSGGFRSGVLQCIYLSEVTVIPALYLAAHLQVKFLQTYSPLPVRASYKVLIYSWIHSSCWCWISSWNNQEPHWLDIGVYLCFLHHHINWHLPIDKNKESYSHHKTSIVELKINTFANKNTGSFIKLRRALFVRDHMWRTSHLLYKYCVYKFGVWIRVNNSV